MFSSEENSRIKPFLEGSPRVHYNHLEYVEDEYQIDGEYYHNGKKFTGIAWSEIRGTVHEDTLVDGLRHGRCVIIHPNGQIGMDGYYEEDEPVGELICWHSSGVMSNYSRYNEQSSEMLSRDFNEKGIMVREVDKREGWRQRLWTEEGKPLYESTDEYSKIFGANGEWALIQYDRGRIEDRKPNEYSHEVLYQYAADILSIDLDLTRYPILEWLGSLLDANDERAKGFLFGLLDQPSGQIVRDALDIIAQRGYRQALHRVEGLIDDRRLAGFDSTIGERAEICKAKLSGEGSVEEIVARYWRNKRKWEKELERRSEKVKKTWPQTIGKHVESLIGQLTLQSGDQVMTGEYKERKIEHLYIYEYKVDGFTYRAVYTTQNPEPELEKSIRYRKKKPEQYYFDS